MENRYKNAKVYKIIGPVENSLVYVGSTCKLRLSQRMTSHRSHYKAWKAGTSKGYVSSYKVFDMYGVDKCSIVLLEECNIESKDLLRQREQFYIDSITCVNKVRAAPNPCPYNERCKEYYNDNKEQISKQSKQHYQDNKEIICERLKQYYQQNKDIVCEKVKQYRQLHKDDCAAYNTKYYEENRDELLLKKQQYFADHKLERQAYAQLTVRCVACDIDIKRCTKARHEKSLRHLSNV